MDSLFTLSRDLRSANEQLRKINDLFKYKTPEEDMPGRERLADRDLFIEIGGPCTHCRLGILTRGEHTLLSAAIKEVVETRIIQLNKKLDQECSRRIFNK